MVEEEGEGAGEGGKATPARARTEGALELTLARVLAPMKSLALELALALVFTPPLLRVCLLIPVKSKQVESTLVLREYDYLSLNAAQK